MRSMKDAKNVVVSSLEGASIVFFLPPFSCIYTMSIMLDAPTPPNGGKWELMSYVQLGDVGASDMIDIGTPSRYYKGTFQI